jgi:hypothetical protein
MPPPPRPRPPKSPRAPPDWAERAPGSSHRAPGNAPPTPHPTPPSCRGQRPAHENGCSSPQRSNPHPAKRRRLPQHPREHLLLPRPQQPLPPTDPRHAMIVRRPRPQNPPCSHDRYIPSRFAERQPYLSQSLKNGWGGGMRTEPRRVIGGGGVFCAVPIGPATS